MKFISFIASTMLIALISQQSTMGLPLNNTVEENVESASIPFDTTTIGVKGVPKAVTPQLFGSCPDGMEHGEHGICQKIKSPSIPFDKTTIFDENVVPKEVTPPLDGACPDGMEHGEHGICQDIKPASIPLDKTTIFDENVVPKEVTPPLDGACADGWEHGEHGICQKIKSASIPVDTTTILYEKPVLKKDSPRRFGSCPDGMEHGEHGICQDIKSHDMIKATTELTDDTVKPKEDIDESKDDSVKSKDDDVKSTDDGLEKKDDVTKPSKYEIPRGCPEGTKPDERGYCVEITPSKLTKPFDPKMFLNKDGSCPPNYVMIGETCWRSTFKKFLGLLAFPTTRFFPSDDSIKFEYVLRLVDNSCPEGTEYSDYGLCRKRIYPTMSNKFVKVDGHCAVDYELVNGECVLKKKVEMPYLINATKPVEIESVTLQPASYHMDAEKKFTSNWG